MKSERHTHQLVSSQSSAQVRARRPGRPSRPQSLKIRKPLWSVIIGWCMGVALTLVAGMGCAPVKLAVPSRLSTDDSVLDVKGRVSFGRGEVQAGAFQALEVRRGAKVALELTGAEASGREEGISFFVAHQGKEVGEVACRLRYEQVALNLRLKEGFSPAPNVTCLIAVDGDEAPGRLLLQARRPAGTLSGMLELAGQRLDVYSTEAASNTRNDVTIGFMVNRAGKPVAAVQTVNGGRIWLDETLSEAARQRLAASTLALLLIQDFNRPVTVPQQAVMTYEPLTARQGR